MSLVEPVMVWRLVPARHAERAFDGEGARLSGGRWNHPGTPVVYTSTTLSLATLELLVHLDPDLLPQDLVAIAARLPARAEVERLDPPGLPKDWRTYPAPAALQDLGTEWQRSGRSLALQVPSAVIPGELNVLVNPDHPTAHRIVIAQPEPFALDPRVLKQGARPEAQG